MKNTFFILALFSCFTISAQTNFEVTPKPAKYFDIVLIPFGVDHAIYVGNLNENGKGSINIKTDISKVSESVRKEYTSKISEALGFCDQMMPEITDEEDIESIEPGPYFLYNKGGDSIGTPKGFVIPVSDTALFQWVTNPDKSTPALGAYYNLIYVDENFNYKGYCSEKFEDDSVDSQTEYRIDLHLKQGWNYIAYEVESIRKATDDIPAFPEKVSITSLQSLPPDVKWMAYYY